MQRALWTAATGMRAQQTAVDTISNNIANVNTVGYKAQTAQFKSLLYQTLQTETTTSNGDPKPTQAQVGLGTRVASLNSYFATGSELATENPMGLFIQGDGFFAVQNEAGEVAYTRDGDLNWTLAADGRLILTNNSGNPILDTQNNVIQLPQGVNGDNCAVDSDGSVYYFNPDGTAVDTNQDIGLFQFQNREGLEKRSTNMFVETDASGQVINESNTNLPIARSSIVQGYIEGSNVNVADEMVNLIVTQRAYELNSKAITTSDSMMETANNLRR